MLTGSQGGTENIQPIFATPDRCHTTFLSLLPFLFQIKEKKLLCHDASFILIWFHKRRVRCKRGGNGGMGRKLL
jgi:hypothetical protein